MQQEIIKFEGSAYRMNDGALECAPLFVDDTIDEDAWGEVTAITPEADAYLTAKGWPVTASNRFGR